MEEKKEIAMKVELGKWLTEHLSKMTETTSKISNEGEVTNFKIETDLLEAILYPYWSKRKEKLYYKDIKGYDRLENENREQT